MRLGILKIFLMVASFPVAVCAQGSISPNWTHSWGGSNTDQGNAIATDTSGNVLVVGSTNNFGAGGQDVLLLKYDSSGNLLWERTWGGFSTDYGTAVAADPGGNIYVTGGTQSFGAGSYDVFLLKFDAAGNLLWSKTWGGGSYDVGHDIAFDASGNVLVGAESYSYRPPSTGFSSAAIIKFTPDGNLLWSRVWASGVPVVSGPVYDGGYSLDVDANGNILLSGITWDYNVSPNHNSIFIVKFDSSGNFLWNRNWAGPSEDEAWGTKTVRADPAGNVYVAGRTSSQCASSNFATCDFDVLLLKLDSNGNFVRSNTWKPDTGYDTAFSFAFDQGGNVVVTGVKDEFGPTGAPILLRFDPNGNLLSSLAWSGGPQAVGSAVAVDSAGNILVAGNAPNNLGSWQSVTGSTGTENGTLSAQPNSAVTSLTVTLGSPSGTITSPTGVSDAGGGGQDAWVVSFTFGLSQANNPPSSLGPAGSTVNPQQSVSEPISSGTGNYYYTHSDLSIPSRGMPLTFLRQYNSLDSYAGPLGANWTHNYNLFLAQDVNGNVTIKWGDGHSELYVTNGGGFTPQTGVFSTLTRNADGSFLLVTKDQRKYSFVASGQLTSIQDRNDNFVSMAYGTTGALQSVTAAGGQSLAFSYDSSNRITQVTDTTARAVNFMYSSTNDLIQTTDPAGGITTYAYDSSHRVTSIMLPNGNMLLQNAYDSNGRVLMQTNGRGLTTTLAYNSPAQGLTTITDARGKQTVHTYDASLRIMAITDPAGGVISYTYDTNNDRASVTNQNGKTTKFLYDSQGNVIDVTDPLGNTTSFTYDANNNLLTTTNARGSTTTFSYDSNGNLLTIQDALGNATAFAYDSSGELKLKTDARGNVTSYTYNASGNLTQITDPLSHTTTLAYDGIGRLTSLTDPNGNAASSGYDALGHLILVADPLGNQTQFAYDAVGNILKITDANGHATSYAYDATNNLVSVTDALGHVTLYGYDANNNRVTFTNAKGYATTYAYDALNHLLQITDPLSLATSYAYDPVGKVLAATDAKAQTNQLAYDALSRLILISYADGNTVAYSYDADGNRTSMVDSHGTTTYVYDSLDRVNSITYPGGKVVSYGYDTIGNRKLLTYPDGKSVAYSYDPTNRLAQVTDWLGRVTNFAYDAANHLTGTSYPNGTSLAFSLDSANRLTQVVNSLNSAAPIVLQYSLDPAGNRTAESIGGVATNFFYDALNELLTSQLGAATTTWTYDAVGNRLKQSGLRGAIKYTYDADDRLLSAGATTFSYDANGNRVSETKTRTNQPITYQYDAANRLTAVTAGSITSSFGYDGDGNRFSQSAGKTTYTYVNDTAMALPVVLQESAQSGNISYAYGLDRISESGTRFDNFYHYDGLGSVIALSNDTGTQIASYLYDPWGNPQPTIANSVGVKNKFRFTGEALDPGTGLYYLRARYYDSSVGRLLSRDHFGGLETIPLTLNRYGYALANPESYRDPSGLLSILGTLQFFTGLWGLTPSVDNAYQGNQQLSQQCGYLGTGNFNNCTPQLQQKVQNTQNEAIQKIGEFAVSQVGTANGNVPGISELVWLWNQAKDLLTIPVANAQEPYLGSASTIDSGSQSTSK